jgi:hypothetical protein
MSWFLAVGLLAITIWKIKEIEEITSKSKIASSVRTILFVFLQGYIVFFPIYYFFSPNYPEICIDNYSNKIVNIYIDDELWLEGVPVSSNLKENSLDNDFYSIEAGSHYIAIKDINGSVLQETKILAEENRHYVLNILNKVNYLTGTGPVSSNPSINNETIVDAMNDTHFEEPPKKSYKRRNRQGGTVYSYDKRWIIRKSINY